MTSINYIRRIHFIVPYYRRDAASITHVFLAILFDLTIVKNVIGQAPLVVAFAGPHWTPTGLEHASIFLEHGLASAVLRARGEFGRVFVRWDTASVAKCAEVFVALLLSVRISACTGLAPLFPLCLCSLHEALLEHKSVFLAQTCPRAALDHR